MEYGILGPLEVTAGGRPVLLAGVKQRSLLAILLLHAEHVVSTDRLIDLLWEEEPPGTAPNTLQVYVSQLRKLLEPGRGRGQRGSVLVRQSPGYVLHVGPDQIDARRFERLAAEGRRAMDEGMPEVAADVLGRALALWRGPALADFSYEPFARNETARLEELRMSAWEERIEAELALGRHPDVVGELEALVSQHPLREGLRRQLMLALYRSGRQAEALQAYQDARKVLDDELGIEPSSSLRELEAAILRQESSLMPPRREPSPASQRRPAPSAEHSAPVVAPHAPARKTVTVLCCEITPAPVGDAELDPEALGAVSARVVERARAVVGRHGGGASWIVGDQMLTLFGVPVVHEDDALRAARAALEIREALDGLRNAPSGGRVADFELRAGIDTGQLFVDGDGSGTSVPAGESLNVAVKLARAALPGEILVGRETYRLVKRFVEAEPTESLTLQRRKDRYAVFRLVGLAQGAGDGRRLNAPMVGREQELAALRAAYERVVKERSCHLFTVLGAAGVGKSRLVTEFLRGLEGEAAIFTGRCPPYGEGVTLLPVAEIIRQAAGVVDDRDADVVSRIQTLLREHSDGEQIADRVVQVCGLPGTPGSVEETDWAVRKLLEVLARRRPVVVIVDDVHWGEPALLDLIEHVADWSRGAPLLLVCLARPEFLDQRPSWGGGKVNASSILLEPLADGECRVLLRTLLGEEPSQPDIESRIVAAAEGNPLFIEETARMLVDEGHLRLEHGRWVAYTDLARLAIPPTVEALIAARLDRLEPTERDVLRRASVVGRVFAKSAAIELCPDDVRSNAARHLMSLMRKELIRPDHSDPAQDDTFRFRHMLIREAAYEQLPKRQRAALHEKLARWLESDSHRGGEELVGHHLERSFRYRRDLGDEGEQLDALGRRAAELLASAAATVAIQGNVTTAISLLERTVDLMPRDDERRLRVLLELATLLTDVGELKRAEDLLDEVIAAAAKLGDRRLEARGVIQLWESRSSSDNQVGWKHQALEDVARAMSVFEEYGDDLGMAKALYLKAVIYQIDYRFMSADAALQGALVHARRTGDSQEEAKIHYAYAMSSLWGPVNAADGIERYKELLARFDGNRLIEASCYRGIALFEAMRGRFGEARDLLARAAAILDDLGATLIAATSLVPGMVELLAGDAQSAERYFRASYEALQRAGEKNARVTAAAYVARALYEGGRFAEAERVTRIGEELTPEDDLAARLEWETTRAKLLARQGDGDGAEKLSREAVEIAEGMDDLETHATALLDRAEVFRLAALDQDAAPLVRTAIELFERKGDEVSATRARGVLRELARPAVIDITDATVLRG
jgi:DNA-binding SARP family transcriptional activator/class 3 adenylate cyclase